MKFNELVLVRSRAEMEAWPEGKYLIEAVNVHTFSLSRRDMMYSSSLLEADALLPDDAGIVKACHRLKLENAPEETIDGQTLIAFEMGRLERKGGGKCFLLGGTPEVAGLIRQQFAAVYPHVQLETYFPSFKPFFTKSEDQTIIDTINKARPDLLLVAMGTPKQEKWLYYHWKDLEIQCHAATVSSFVDTITKALPDPSGKKSGFKRFLKKADHFLTEYLPDHIDLFLAILKEKSAA